MSIREHSRKSVTLITGISLLFGDFFVPLQLMKRASYIFLIVLMLAACGGWRDGQRLLDRADSLLYGQPDSALRLLDSITEDDQERMSEAQLMRYHLLRADAQNKCFVPFTTDSIMKEVAHYYERKGTPNEQMRAYYLLGRAYYDMGETPMALKYFHEAADCADTTQADCDFKLLSRVHGQMGRLFLDQGAPRDALEEYRIAQQYAHECSDTLNELYCFTNQGNAYLYLNLPDSAILIKEYVSKLFHDNGFAKDAVMTLAPLIDLYVGQGKYEVAKRIMERYEAESGLFDKNRNISYGREIYYYSKGLYYLGTHRNDSALFFFRKLLSDAHKPNHYECGYAGLAKFFHEKGNQDSAYYYASLAYSYTDTCHREKATEFYQRCHSLYNYSRQQQIAVQKTEEARENRHRWIFAISLSGIIILGAFLFIFVLRNRNERLKLEKQVLQGSISHLEEARSELLVSKKELSKLLELKDMELNTAEDELEKTKTVLLGDKNRIEAREKYWHSIIESKQEEIEEKECRIQMLESKLQSVPENDMISAIRNLPVVIELRQRMITKGPSKMTYNQWTQLQSSVDTIIPSFFSFLSEYYPKLRSDDLIILYLTRVYFSTGEIALLTNNTSSAVSMKKSRLLKKIFDIKGGARDFEDRVRKL